ncbi:unnamed protein product [Leptosia nina]|uniref:Uncharacterized protein n=1 Tax=Leptosia nina TaxID=320188 RepID=A0AAV1JAX7_9NEOP
MWYRNDGRFYSASSSSSNSAGGIPLTNLSTAPLPPASSTSTTSASVNYQTLFWSQSSQIQQDTGPQNLKYNRMATLATYTQPRSLQVLISALVHVKIRRVPEDF